MTIDEVIAGLTTIEPSRSDGQWHYTVRTNFALHQLLNGRLELIVGADLALLTTNLGWQPEWRHDLHYDEAANGGSPALAQVIGDAGAAVGARIAEIRAEWCGKAASARLEPQA